MKWFRHALATMPAAALSVLSVGAQVALADDPPKGKPGISLPDARWFRPDIPDMDKGSAALVIINLLNWLIGTVAVIMLVYASWPVVKYGWDMLHGHQQKEALKVRGINLVLGVVLLLLALTGAWYPVLKAVVEGIANQLNGY